MIFLPLQELMVNIITTTMAAKRNVSIASVKNKKQFWLFVFVITGAGLNGKTKNVHF